METLMKPCQSLKNHFKLAEFVSCFAYNFGSVKKREIWRATVGGNFFSDLEWGDTKSGIENRAKSR
jgi:hypothetical protein